MICKFKKEGVSMKTRLLIPFLLVCLVFILGPVLLSDVNAAERSQSAGDNIDVASLSCSSASHISLNTWYSGVSSTEPELFKFTTTGRSDSKYTFIIRTTYAEQDYYTATIDFGEGEDILAYSYYNDDEDYTSTRSLKDNKTYTIRVYGDHYGFYRDNVEYEFIVKEVIAKPAKGRITSLKGGKKKLTVKYSKLGKASRYQIAFKKKGGSYKYKYTTSTSKTIKGLKSKKYYYVKVRGQRYARGKYYSGKWSATKKVKIK